MRDRTLNIPGTFKLRNVSVEDLKSKGYARNPLMDFAAYSKRFSVHKSMGISTLDCVLTVALDDGEIRIDVYSNYRDLYPHFYTEKKSVRGSLLYKVDCRIYKELYEIDAIHKNESNKSANKRRGTRNERINRKTGNRKSGKVR